MFCSPWPLYGGRLIDLCCDYCFWLIPFPSWLDVECCFITFSKNISPLLQRAFYILQLWVCDLGISLSGSNVLMTEEFLDVSDVGAVFE